jgi:hypothetical protein
MHTINATTAKNVSVSVISKYSSVGLIRQSDQDYRGTYGTAKETVTQYFLIIANFSFK